MRHPAMTWVWEQTGLEPYERLVLLCLADHADKDRRCWPSLLRMCERTGMKERGVQNVLRRLTEGGLISVEKGGGRSRTNIYTLNLNPASDTGNDEINPAPDAPLNPAPNAPFEEETPHPITETPHLTTLNPAPGAPEPKRTKKNQEKEEEGARAHLQPFLGEDLADDWIAHRREIRKPITARGGKALAGELSRMNDPPAAVRRAIANGWQGVFEDKTVHPFPNRGSNGSGLDDHLDQLKARLAVQRLE